MSRRKDWARRLGIASTLVLLATAIVVGARGKTPPPQARVPASTVIAASGRVGVVLIRDGAVVRIDRQSPPGRLIIPRPARAPWPDGLAVGRSRVWVSSQGLVRGYAVDDRPVRAFRVTASNPLIMAEAGRVLWAATPWADRVLGGDLRGRPVRFAAVRLPCQARFLTARGGDGWVLCDAARRRALLVRVTPGVAPVVVAELPGRARGVSAARVFVWALTERGLYRLDPRDQRLLGPFGVTPRSTELAAGPGRVLTLDEDLGIVLERTPAGRVHTYNVGEGARALAAASRGFWVTVGDQATPRFVEYATP